MMFVIGILLFALAILVSVALHECGHMWVARATGMKVRRYFVGFGPTLWSTHRPNRLGSTEYGVKAVPLGGFCDIAGMTSVDEIAPEDEPHAMYKQKVWKRVAVLFAGPAMNFIIGLVLIYSIAVMWGLPNLHPNTSAVIGQTACVAPQISKTGDDPFGPCPHPGAGPAAVAGLKSGDTVIEVGGKPVSTFEEMAKVIRTLNGPVPIVYERAGQKLTTTVAVEPTQRFTKDAEAAATVGAIGVTAAQQAGPTHYNVLTAVPATFTFTGDLTVELGKSLAKIPTKVGALVHSIGGGTRDPETPISVVGASIIGGDTVDHGLWVMFWFFLAQLNFVLGAVNLLPLLPFDGGHIAVAVFEKIRNMVRASRGKVAAAPVNYLKLMPATYVVLVVVGGYMLLTVTADLVNPIRIFQ
ncbi:site-2 protease family protein [Mycobacterium sp. CBMA293]|uniref:M50 family metallopeptidase n=1 Tax=unclassified Mycolicibacterium TaxID=2636767 RepID=UPI0012DC1856|nr:MULTISPECIES: M50 family metallopeptidase [unclassified Mycolicibacterium]MUL44969.1 site-2 protease family protein [Mycolicibacterium sp. CBMA 360]MUL57922.1 site-2 protease family protein [Mycolicibacterium sp. CBMA 335]MUL72629.1 site-2 protease family protein [Mycolicibacterium sp. CBMA 311]MUL95562.1 site-2 protease family protein [Mycolicibacterium sp. CBMA 230]MUM07353.1 zinc metalloprotease [Mycolicibacterium sp. CBMA 213]